jgi:hypothetical protein
MATRDDDENPKPSTPKPLNRLSLESLRISQDFAENLGATKLFTSCPVRKPRNQDWVRVCPDPAYQLVGIALLELKEDREQYLVLRLNRKVHRVGPSPPPATASDEWLVGGPMNLLSVSEH